MAAVEKLYLEQKLNDYRYNFINSFGCINQDALDSFNRLSREIQHKGFTVVLDDGTNRLVIVGREE